MAKTKYVNKTLHKVKFYLHLNYIQHNMKTYILPNWCKKLGITLFIISSLLNGSVIFFNNYINSAIGLNVSEQNLESGFKGLLDAFSGGLFSYSIEFIAIVAILIYMISKEKVEDDYINKLRLESFQLTFIFCLLITIVVFVTNKELKITLDYFIFPLLWSYIIIFFIKRRLYL